MGLERYYIEGLVGCLVIVFGVWLLCGFWVGLVGLFGCCWLVVILVGGLLVF